MEATEEQGLEITIIADIRLNPLVIFPTELDFLKKVLQHSRFRAQQKPDSGLLTCVREGGILRASYHWPSLRISN